MKILLASDCYTYQINGVSRVVRSLSRGLCAMGHDVRVLAPANSFKSFRNGADYYIKSVPALYYKGERFSLNLWDPLIRELTEWEPDIIHLHSEGGVALLTDRIRKKTGTSSFRLSSGSCSMAVSGKECAKTHFSPRRLSARKNASNERKLFIQKY